MGLLDRIAQVGKTRAVEIDGLVFYVKTRNIRQQLAFSDKLLSLNTPDETDEAGDATDYIDKLIGMLAESIEKIDGVDDIKEFLGTVPKMSDLSMIGQALGKELTEKEAKNSSSPSASPTSAAGVSKGAKKKRKRAGSTKKK